MLEIIRTFRGMQYGVLKLQSGEKKKKQNPKGHLSALCSCITFYCDTMWVGIGSLWLASLVTLILLNVALTHTTWCFQDKHNTFWSFLPFGCMAVSKRLRCSTLWEKLAPLRRLQSCWILAIRVCICRGPTWWYEACCLLKVPLGHLFLLILWAGKAGGPRESMEPSAQCRGYLLRSVYAVNTNCLSFRLKCVSCGRAVCGW